ncbi:MAG TPA: cysteine synthase A [Solibacterales bacterium]|nr:cysteine synthase A [Bryobacterales bacterium]
MNIAKNISALVGNTPLVEINRLAAGSSARVVAKLEFFNPGHSVKDRIAVAMLDAAIAAGKIGPDSVVLEPTSGNTGIGLAMVCAVKGYRLVLVMPDSMSVERRRLMLAYGATFELTPREKGMKGSIARAEEIVAATPGAWMPQQFDNPANIEAHVQTTAREILADFPQGLDVLITGVGTGGHLTGCARVLKAQWPTLKVYAVEPTASPVLSGGEPGPHKIQGIGAGFIPSIVDRSVIDGVEQVSNEDAFDMARKAARTEGIPVGISSGAALVAAFRQAALDENAGKTIVVIIPSFAERYLSTALFEGL